MYIIMDLNVWDGCGLQSVIINQSDGKKIVKSWIEDSAVDYWAFHVGGTKKNNKHFYTKVLSF